MQLIEDAARMSPGPTHRVFAALADDLTWFIMCPEIRVHHVATSPTTRPIVVHQLALTEGHGHNRSPFLVLEDAFTKDDSGWLARAERVAVIHDARRKAMASEGYELRPLPRLVHEENSLLVMGRQLVQCLEAQRDIHDLDGIIVVLAPSVLEKPKAFVGDVLALLRTPSLARVRFVVIELGDELTKPFQDTLGNGAQFTNCIIDPVEQWREQTDAIAASAALPPGASPEALAGGAGPKNVIAPPRHGHPPRDAALSPDEEKLLQKELGRTAALIGAGGALLKRRLTGAALAMQEQRFDVAVGLQVEACNQCLEAGLLRLACILEVTLAAYMLRAGQTASACAAFETVAARAEDNGMSDVAAQALLGLAAVLVLQKDVERGVQSYAKAGELAERGNTPILAIEAYRTAGQVALRAGSERGAIQLWNRALAVAEKTPATALSKSSAPAVARALAKVMKDNGSFDAANSLLAQADEYERDVRNGADAPHDVAQENGE